MVGVPVMAPLAVPMARPAGRPVAVQVVMVAPGDAVAEGARVVMGVPETLDWARGWSTRPGWSASR